VGLGTSAEAASNPQTVVSTDVTTNTTWSGEIILDGPVVVTNGATLTILAGTIIRGRPRQNSDPTLDIPGTLIVATDGRINASGSASNPIIFTTGAIDNNADGNPDDVDGNPGFLDPWTSTSDTFLDANPKTAPLSPMLPNGTAAVDLWGGVVVLGNAPTNLGTGPGAGYGRGQIEGLAVPGQIPAALAQYGGLDPHDSSGILRFISIRHAGDDIDTALGNELNGISLGGVGDGTIFENIEVYCNFDDGIEWFGGTVHGKRLAVFFAGDDTFDLDQGYTGLNQFLFGVMPYFNENGGGAWGSASGDKGTEFDGDDFNPTSSATNPLNVNVRRTQDGTASDPTPWPLSGPAIYNMTIIGSSPPSPAFPATSPAAANRGIQMRNGFAGVVANSIVVNTGTAPVLDVINGDASGGVPGFKTCDNNVPNGLVAVISSTFDDSAGGYGGCAAGAIANGNAIAAARGAGPNYRAGSFAGLVVEDQTFPLTGLGGTGKLGAGIKPTKLNPRPVSSVETLLGITPQGPGLDAAATYRGAFQRTATRLWTTGWTALSIGGVLAD
jgi:hypothetical protein